MGYCIYVGDSPHDMQAAVTGGATAVAALWGAFTAAEVIVPGTDYALCAIGELIDLLDGETAGLSTTSAADRCETLGDRGSR